MSDHTTQVSEIIDPLVRDLVYDLLGDRGDSQGANFEWEDNGDALLETGGHIETEG